MRFLPGNAQDIGARHSQQDSFGFADPDDSAFIGHGGFLAIVCDGMGGMEHGDAASRTAVRAFMDAYQRKAPGESIPVALERSVREANSQVVALAHSFGLTEGIGTTLVAAVLQNSLLYFVSVGDSGLFHVSGGQMRMINHPHVFANLLDKAVARGTLSKEDAESHPERDSLTSFIGAESLEEIDLTTAPLPMRDGDTILLASDGMFKTLDPAEMLACLQGHPQSWPETLVASTLAKRHQYQDNVTVLSVTAESEARASVPRTVLMAPPPPSAAGVPGAAEPEMVAPAVPPVPAPQISTLAGPTRTEPANPASAPSAPHNGADLPRTVQQPHAAWPDSKMPIPAAGLNLQHVGPQHAVPQQSLPQQAVPQPPVPLPMVPPHAGSQWPAAPPGPQAIYSPQSPYPQAQSQSGPPRNGPARSSSRMILLIVLVVLVVAGAAAGYWYFKIRAHGPLGSTPIVDPERRVKAPKTDGIPDLTRDPNAPVLPAPVAPAGNKSGNK